MCDRAGHIAVPLHEWSTDVRVLKVERYRYHQAVGDMWPITWGADDNMYAGAGDNRGSPMNFWRVTGCPDPNRECHQGDWALDLIDNLPLDPVRYCTDPRVDRKMGIKPAGLLDIAGTLYFAVQTQNYGSEPAFNRQTNIQGWFITSRDYGKTWDREATDQNFFTDRLASCHFLQSGRGDENVLDGFVYAYFPCGYDGCSYWENGDAILLGRVRPDAILDRGAWEFFSGVLGGESRWIREEEAAAYVFEYPRMTGENHVSYNRGIGRYMMGNYSFITDDLVPRPYHQGPSPESRLRSQLTLFEAPHPWGPWRLFYRDDNWGTYGDYQPSFPPKWMSNDGKTMFMVSAGTYDDYNFTVQKVLLA